MIINVFKPKAWTSNDVVQKIKHACGFKKVGHAGTLDPLAEGVLLVLTDGDTKRQDEFMNLKKEYLVKVVFGYESDSHDLGTPLRICGKDVGDNLSREALSTALVKYIGRIQQQVPAYSAVHVKGQRLYKVAKEDSSTILSLPYKEIEILDINICSFTNNEQLNYPFCTTAELRISCGKGTYIRSLVRDLGKDLGCGAVAMSLIRTKIGEYNIEGSLTLDKVLLEHLKS
ncbi:MAG: tRNA pseudouridine(55) synthase TruB [Patescibacteria group bacterium]